ncbi:hypothetical protein FF36_02685 [Frankia torreyi]|uniref:Uncharacterized protein n=1 Tax=Frankia torreyi TaxID=1856 RepID=A0A0D8BHL1_9ACTN|nr:MULTISPECIES: hypothetical protein [Frankia]KJE22912.1 hypothetical protein FF36_02685 [Frankia torreyi]KQC36916.1 hypothetical protein UK82_18125 [Frankia sp. ACN1ag]
MWFLLIPPVALLLTAVWVALRGRPDRTSEAMITIAGYRRSMAALARPIPAQSATRTGADLDESGYPEPPPDDDPFTSNTPLSPSELDDLAGLDDLDDLGVATGAQVSPFADTVPIDVSSLRHQPRGRPPETS